MSKTNPIVSEETISTTSPVYATFWLRFAALIIDSLIMAGIGFMLGYLLEIAKQNNSFMEGFFQFMISVSYYVFYQAYYGQTVGKQLLKIKVVTVSGHRPTLFTFFLREVIGKTISSFTLGLGYLWMLVDKKKQTLHDKIARTYVVKV